MARALEHRLDHISSHSRKVDSKLPILLGSMRAHHWFSAIYSSGTVDLLFAQLSAPLRDLEATPDVLVGFHRGVELQALSDIGSFCCRSASNAPYLTRLKIAFLMALCQILVSATNTADLGHAECVKAAQVMYPKPSCEATMLVRS